QQVDFMDFNPNGENKAGMRQLLDMLRSLMPVLDNIKNAVENSSSKIPKATEQLSTVTQATESATMEILNLLDDIGRRVEHVQSKLKEIKNDHEAKMASIGRLSWLLDNVTAEQKAQFPDFETDWKTITDLTLHSTTLDELTAELGEIHSLSMNIAMALQVQDITSQQIESVRHQIESVRTQLSYVVGQYEGRDVVEEPLDPVKKAFDADAQYVKDESRQADADDIIAQFAQQSN
ncbi:MAG: protein phosphatase CheZ, partial [Ignavibacteriales bacterium]|nr:protein phosphatase CheZ [Ignavibacteriales bacterium]